jgi:tetratricopeptide (TPR) repeat protein
VRVPGVRRSFRHVALRGRRVRWAWWRASHAFGWFLRTFLSGIRWLFLVLLAAEAGIVLYRALSRTAHELHWSDLRVASWLALAWLGILLFHLVFQARRRVVVEQFTDATGEEQKPDPRGLSTLLVGEIDRLRDLYTTVDDSAIPTAVQKNRPLDATIKVEDVAGFLESPAMIETKASVGPIQIPLGALLAFVSRLVRGPRLLGSIHVQGDALVLTTELSKSGSLQTWHVERSLPAKGPTGRLDVPQGMVQELAYRMFSDLALSGHVRWRATKDFADALTAIRHCLRTRENRRLNLQQAERSLIDAQEKDDHLGYVYYNLGVVFTELHKLARAEQAEAGTRSDEEAKAHWNAAERAFRYQIRLTPDRWEAYYALAHTYDSREPKRPHDLDYILKRCDRVISMRPGTATTAKALLLKSNANKERGEVKEMIAHRRLAVAEAWSALCRAERGSGADGEAQLAASALKALAVAHCDRHRRWGLLGKMDRARARRLLGRAVKLAPNDAEIRYELSRACKSKPRREIDELDAALRVDPLPFKWWARLALLHAQRAQEQKGNDEQAHASYCCEQALRLLNCFVEDGNDKNDARAALETIAEAYSRLGPDFSAQAEDARARIQVAERCSAEMLDVAALTKDATGTGWAGAEARIALGRHELEHGDLERARIQLGEAVDTLEAIDPDELTRSEARILHARALQRLDEHDKAIEELRAAIGDDPLHRRPREALADVLMEIRDYEKAQKVLKDALRWDPDRADLHQKVGHCYRKMAVDHRETGRRKRAFRNGIRAFSRALELSGHHSLDAQLESHYWLARLYKEIGDYERAIPFLRRATICTGAKPLIHVLLGEAYLRDRAYESAETELTMAIKSAGRPEDKTDYGAAFGDHGWHAGRVIAYAHVLLAIGYAERGVRLKEAAENVVAAGRALREARSVAGLPAAAFDVTEAVRKAAAGLIALKKEDSRRAVARFRGSLSFGPTGQTYLNLARAYSLTADSDAAAVARAKRRGLDACRQARALDVTGRLSPAAKALQAELAAMQPSPKPTPPSTPPPTVPGATTSTAGVGTELTRELDKAVAETTETS